MQVQDLKPKLKRHNPGMEIALKLLSSEETRMQDPGNLGEEQQQKAAAVR